MGAALAGYLASGEAARLPLPITDVRPIPAHALHKLYVGALIAWYRMTDGRVT
jgi:hypothetical protein